MTTPGVRTGFRAGAVSLSVLALVACLFVWTTDPRGDVIVGVDIQYVTQYVGVLHPVAEGFVERFGALAQVAAMLGVTVGVRGNRTRFLAAGVVSLAAAGMVGVGVRILGDLHPGAAPDLVAAERAEAVAVFVLAALLLGTAVALICRRFALHDGFVGVCLAVVGGLHLVSMYLVVSGLSPAMALAAWAWVPGGCLLLAALCTAGTAVRPRAGREAVRPLPA
ncbi:hypothetical protein [Streptomyces sp. NPDC047130]|uniref:hypothetical protein n=1 Tax=Streptomyces sp. NPDC047130 TaxID=3155261 RepID=UPI0033CE7BB7